MNDKVSKIDTFLDEDTTTAVAAAAVEAATGDVEAVAAAVEAVEETETPPSIFKWYRFIDLLHEFY